MLIFESVPYDFLLSWTCLLVSYTLHIRANNFFLTTLTVVDLHHVHDIGTKYVEHEHSNLAVYTF